MGPSCFHGNRSVFLFSMEINPLQCEIDAAVDSVQMEVGLDQYTCRMNDINFIYHVCLCESKSVTERISE